MNPLRSIAWAVLPLLVVPSGLPVMAQGAGQAQIRFTYENPKLQPPKYVLTVGEDGSGHFRSEGGGPVSNDPQNMPAEAQDRPIHISKALREAMFAAARKNKLFAMSCEDGGKNVAFQGSKTLQLEGPKGTEVVLTTGARTRRLISLQTSLKPSL